jgi:hypothetical protein
MLSPAHMRGERALRFPCVTAKPSLEPYSPLSRVCTGSLASDMRMIGLPVEITPYAGKLLVAALPCLVATSSRALRGHITQLTLDTDSASRIRAYCQLCDRLKMYH